MKVSSTLLLTGVLCFLTYSSEGFSSHLYYTHQVSEGELQYDCLYYDVPLKSKREQQPFSHEMIPYCYRPELVPLVRVVNDTRSTTFEELKRQEITVQQLYSWSAPIDLLEHYQLYLDQLTPTAASERFSNCSSPWFGPSCEYTFDSDGHFDDIVRRTFRMKNGSFNEILNITQGGTCYPFLSCLKGPGNSSCLDWREVCDGKMDCVGSGIDERNCFELLDLNQCATDEFRCRNGLCVPNEFLWEGSVDADCLDGSDEVYAGKHFASCYQDPSFRCEERSCHTSLDLFPCGDGECILTPIPTNSDGINRCANGREMKLSRAILARKESPDLLEPCWSAMICALRIYNRFYPLFDSVRCEKICGSASTPSCDSLIKRHCPPLFQFPAHPIAHGHVVFMHTNEVPETSTGVRKPKYLCYEPEFCPKMFPVRNTSNGLSCVTRYQLDGPDSKYNKYHDFISDIVDIFRTCQPIDVIKNVTICQNPDLFYCNDSATCFSKHRLVDGVQDCVRPNDELQACSMPSSHRFHCTSESDKCISPFCVHDKYNDCIGGEDEMADADNRKRVDNYVPFQILCDGFEEYSINTESQAVETDETHCDMWPCNNQYTRCNIYFNCPNGADEVQCPWHSCSGQHLPCVDPVSAKLTCLPLALVNNNVTDCLGSSDERHVCRVDEATSSPEIRYRCWNDSSAYSCLSLEFLCDGDEDCEFGDDEQFCHNDDEYATSTPCKGFSGGDRTPSHNSLCKITDTGKPRDVYFSLKNAVAVSSSIPRLLEIQAQEKNDDVQSSHGHSPRDDNSIDFYRAWYCNRGIFVRHSEEERRCLCPPSYYGERCQFQSQRVSITVQLRAAEHRTRIAVVLTLIDDKENIHSHEQLTYVPFRDCKDKFNSVLLYKLRPKDPSRQYSLRIQAFDQATLTHRATWLFPVEFPVLPVYRLANQLLIPSGETQTKAQTCPLQCQHGSCQRYANREAFYCRCDRHWSGDLCENPNECQCSSDSLCIGFDGKRPVCLCPPHKFGPKCLLARSPCPASYCHSRGECVLSDERVSNGNFVCLCQDGFSGLRCEVLQTQIDISFAANLAIPQAVLGHFITVHNDSKPTQVSTYRRMIFGLDAVTFYFTDPFHVLLTEFGQHLYLTVVQETFVPTSHTSIQLTASHQCLPFEHLLDVDLLKLPRLRYVKHYHEVCRTNPDLTCFYDEALMCLCNQDRFANCFNFNHRATYSCPDYNYCENSGQCFQNSETCQMTLLCVCAECFYGKRCQLTTKGFGLSLDAILGYQIYPNVALSRQSNPVKASIAITTIMALIGFVSSVLSIITFKRKGCREIGCGYYLFASSVCSLTTMTLLLMKFWLLVVSQTNAIRKNVFLTANCVLMDALLRLSLGAGDWLNGIVAVERVISVWKGIHFDQQKSKRAVRWVFLLLFLFLVSTTIHDPIHRYTIFDEEEERTWCLVRYSPILQHFNSVINIVHFLTPLSVNFIAALLIIIRAARVRSRVRAKTTYRHHLREQLNQHKHLLISSVLLILLGLPRLIISFISGCMKSARDPWLFLIGYFVSLIPPTLIFFTFILPSATYRREFKEAIKPVSRCFRL